MRWAVPSLLHLIPLFPALAAAALLLYWRRRRDVAAELGDAPLVRRLMGTDLSRFPRRRAALVVPAALLLGVAAAGPRWGKEEEARPDARRGDVVLVLDASNSMLAEDVAPNRLERQRRAARALLDRLAGSRVALVVFAGNGYVLSPLTSDFEALRLYLDHLGTDIVDQSGSSLYAAIRQGTSLLVGPDGRARGSLVLMTDGDALEGYRLVDEAVDGAVQLGVPVHALGFGTLAGAPVPDVDPETGVRRGFKQDPREGGTARSALGERLLQSIARSTGGSYRAADDAPALAELARAAAAGSHGAGRGRATPADNRYEWFLALALALVAADAVAGHRPPRVRREAA
ncbi:MAG TPA: VWA domain-containing protein [Longimicrobium sp.]|nr:VWA domain-containing protein [Longimicrobium sp.]